MPKFSACLVMGAFAAGVVAPSPIMAFGLHLGPFHFGLPLFGIHHHFTHRHHVALRAHWHRRPGSRVTEREDRFAHRHHVVLHTQQRGAGTRVAEPEVHFAHQPNVALRNHSHRSTGIAGTRVTEPESHNGGGGHDAAVLYPSLAMPALTNDVFWPDRSSAWPFSYEAIFRTAFAKSLPAQDVQSCQADGGESAGLIIARMQSELRPDAAQAQLLQRLGGAIGMASQALGKACPQAVTPEPVARLQLMQAQITALSMAVDLIRPPLQQFEQSLSTEQRAKFAAPPSASAAALACGNPTSTDWSIDQISHSVQPGDNQREAVANLREAFVSAARDLDAHCPKLLPGDPLARLGAIEARLDASWRTAIDMQAALASFESQLTGAQRTRFEAMNVAEARAGPLSH